MSVVSSRKGPSFRQLIVWQKAFELTLAVYKTTENLPSHERYGLTSELRKTARSVVCNIAEGQRRSTRREFARFLDISLGSAAELQTQLLLAERLGYLSAASCHSILSDLEEVNRMLYRLKASLA